MPVMSELRLDGRRRSGVGAFGGDAIVVSDRGWGGGNLSSRGRSSGSLSSRARGAGGNLSNRGRWLGGLSDRSNGMGAQRECHDPDEDDGGHAAGDDDLARCLGVHIEILSWWVGSETVT